MAAEIKRALIIGAAPCSDWSFLNPYLELWSPCLSICADGGYDAAVRLGIHPDFVVGDWDSGSKPPDSIPCKSFPVEKDFTDLEAAVEQAVSLGAVHLLLVGCTGGRLDHTASNLTLLEGIADRGACGIIVDSDSEARLLEPGLIHLSNIPPYHYASIVPLDREVCGVSLRGFKYPLDNAVLHRGSTLSVSNEPSSPDMDISIQQGRALFIRSQRTD